MLNRHGTKGIARLSGFVLGAAVLFCTLSPHPATGGDKPALQALVVTTTGWSAGEAALQLHERESAESPWMAVGGSLPAVVGRNGLAWGKGIHPEAPAGGPQKREGDEKSPAGIFKLGVAFGYSAAESVPWIRLPYRQVTERSKCVDDVASSFYNRLADEDTPRKDWNSAEDMRRQDEQYRLGIVIEHNSDPVWPGDGSCIFLHIWEAPLRGTSGCTALSAADMEEILGRLRPEANPLLIQLPREEYDILRSSQGFP